MKNITNLKYSFYVCLILVGFIKLFADDPKEKVLQKEDTCEKEAILGTYSDICDCGQKNVVILDDNSDMEIIQFEEVWDCHVRLKWLNKGDYIVSEDHPYVKSELFKLDKDRPVKEKWLNLVVGSDTEKKNIEKKYEKNMAIEQALIYKKPQRSDSVFANDLVLYKVYSHEYFKSLKCEKNRNSFLKRMIYFEKFISSDEKEVLKFFDQLGKDKIDFNFKDTDGINALIAAIDCEFIKTIALLLKRGIDPNVKNSQGNSPLELAKQNKRKDIEELLKKYGAKE